MKETSSCFKLFLFVLFIFSVVSAYAESCSSVGSTQNKYTASGCRYTTQTRTCCSNGSWSEWDKACGKADCTSDQCWNGSKCEDRPPTQYRPCKGNVPNTVNGEQSRSALCRSSGWEFGAWVGLCLCEERHIWKGEDRGCEPLGIFVWDNGKGNYISFCDDEPNCVSKSIAGTECTSLWSEKSVCITEGYSNGMCIVKDFTCVEK